LAAVPAPPEGCRSFYVTRADERYYEGSEVNDGIYRHSADAMVLAELIHLPTINGYASFQPPDYYLFFPDSPEYPGRIRAYVEQHQLEGLCGLDMMTRTWSVWTP
jgi:hypothetical protein